MPAASPGAGINQLVVRYTLTVNGSAVASSIGIVSVEIVHEINKISYAEFLLTGDSSIADTSTSFTDDDSFSPGNTISFTAGYGDGEEVPIFDGVIVKHGLEINKSSTYNLKLTCKHKAVSMTFGRKEQEFKGKTDSDIISAIGGTYGISCTVDSTSFQNELFLQKLATDWDLVLSRAEFNGFIIAMDGTGLTVGKPKLSESAVLNVATGESIIEFQGELNAEKQPTSVEASGWDIANLALQKATASEPSVNEQGSMTSHALSGTLSQSKITLSSLAPMSTDELQAWADSYLLRARLSAFKGKVTFIGSSAIKTGGILALSGISKKFNGNAFVSSVIHKVDNKSWKTTAHFGLPNKPVFEMPDYSYAAANGQIPAIHGLHVGTVKQLAQDPQSLFRILVDIPSNADSPNGLWARYANFYATNNAGLGFLPEVGDEVLVGFIENDPRYPIVLGSLYGSKNAAPNPAADENNYIKSITTKSNLKLSFDDEKKIITIQTPGGNSITISDDGKLIEIADQNSNTVKLSSSGIDLNSGKDVSISATGDVKINATGKLTLAAQQDLTGTGMNISMTANMGLTAKGSTTAEISASGQTTVKGGIVMIN